MSISSLYDDEFDIVKAGESYNFDIMRSHIISTLLTLDMPHGDEIDDFVLRSLYGN